ncbi:NADPH-dependent 7-cyano-7-deazaguanine reductase QueF [Rhodocyclaceae bacterium SMB388]
MKTIQNSDDPDRTMPLGRPVSYRDSYAPELLFPIARQTKRDELGLSGGALPFHGVDLWNAYEVSWLDGRGKPVVALGRFEVPADSPCLVESKSLKLYLNSFNQTRFVDISGVRDVIARDLSVANGARVDVELTSLSARPVRRVGYPDGVLLDELDVEIRTYQPDPSLLSCDPGGEAVTETLFSHLLKSNCLVTGQPDWGSIFVRYRGARIDREGLLRYIVSFRGHDEFHEQCVERIFCDILRRCLPVQLMVWARYTRRGGLDINPYRTTEPAGAVDDQFEVRQ